MKSVLDDPSLCCGCSACAAACTHDSIRMEADSDGFAYPVIDPDTCVDCGACRRTCPASPDNRDSTPLHPPESVLAAWNLDDTIRRQSSSGGVFTPVAELILADGGVVIGASFEDELVLRHVEVESPLELERLRGSKYLQSELPHALLRRIRTVLASGRKVLFTGTPCQVAGLRRFIRKESPNLVCVDILCHGVPSSRLFRKQLAHEGIPPSETTGYAFRDKSRGWKSYSTGPIPRRGIGRRRVATSDPFMIAFLRDYALRSSCYSCPFAQTSRTGDLTLGDFWGVHRSHPHLDLDDKGTSLVLVGTDKGRQILDSIGHRIFQESVPIESAFNGNPILSRPSHRPSERDVFLQDLGTLSYPQLIRKYRLRGRSRLQILKARAKNKAKAILKSILHRPGA